MKITNVIGKIKNFLRWPISKKIQFAINLYFKLKVATWYRYVFKNIGKQCLVKSPLFITPEFISLGDNVIIWNDARIEAITHYANEHYTPTITLGDGVNIQQRCHITAASDLLIGTNTMISFDVSIQDTDHEYFNTKLPVGEQPLLVRKTDIGKNCFIGSGAKIQAGTTLGDHCIVGTNAVVRGEFPDYCVLVGTPARVIKRYNPSSKCWEKTDPAGSFL